MADDSRLSTSSPNKSIEELTPDKASKLSPEEAKTYYTWSNFFGALMSPDALGRTYVAVQSVVNEERDCKKCDEWKEWLFSNSPIIRFLSSEISKIGPPLDPSHVRCRRCGVTQSGGFDSNYGILLCANTFRTRGKLEDTLAHEMVHAWDHSRFKVDQNNMRHQACTEIRAATLSGECRFYREFWQRGQYKVSEGFQDCVRRRAELSLRARPQIKDEQMAKNAVNEVWDSCFTDTRPFDEIYR
ncbi:hypothetical protein NA57DRAFT_39010 [Rhizodiscina lignyota]|uniref:Mitochondrial inner membrane protease ATP23 n=1 Tax=Rhizodiscina lignyota TaxID=1504668 RepID=A0A9P4IGS5_9PEZI|nr:hypothetical protein NA57DRAFT_39010 [Rhizodiscina lignyota]